MKFIPHDYQTRAKDFILEHPKPGRVVDKLVRDRMVLLREQKGNDR